MYNYGDATPAGFGLNAASRDESFASVLGAAAMMPSGDQRYAQMNSFTAHGQQHIVPYHQAPSDGRPLPYIHSGFTGNDPQIFPSRNLDLSAQQAFGHPAYPAQRVKSESAVPSGTNAPGPDATMSCRWGQNDPGFVNHLTNTSPSQGVSNAQAKAASVGCPGPGQNNDPPPGPAACAYEDKNNGAFAADRVAPPSVTVNFNNFRAAGRFGFESQSIDFDFPSDVGQY